jgi:hypothetical protein
MDTPQNLKLGLAYIRNSRSRPKLCSVIGCPLSRNVFWRAPVILATVDVTCAGWPIAAAQAWSSIFTPAADAIVSNSRRASSGEISSMRRERPITRPMADTCSNWLSDWGAVRTYSAPACPSSRNARTATAAMSRSSIGESERRDAAGARHRRLESAASTSAEHLRRTFRAAETSTGVPRSRSAARFARPSL